MRGHAYARLKQIPLPPFAYREGPTLGTLHELETILRSSEAPMTVSHIKKRLHPDGRRNSPQGSHRPLQAPGVRLGGIEGGYVDLERRSGILEARAQVGLTLDRPLQCASSNISAPSVLRHEGHRAGQKRREVVCGDGPRHACRGSREDTPTSRAEPVHGAPRALRNTAPTSSPKTRDYSS